MIASDQSSIKPKGEVYKVHNFEYENRSNATINLSSSKTITPPTI